MENTPETARREHRAKKRSFALGAATRLELYVLFPLIAGLLGFWLVAAGGLTTLERFISGVSGTSEAESVSLPEEQETLTDPVTPAPAADDSPANWETDVVLLRSEVMPSGYSGDFFWLLEIENLSQSKVYFVKVSGIAKDSDGKFVDETLTWELILLPGQRSQFVTSEIMSPLSVPVTIETSLTSSFSRNAADGEESAGKTWAATNVDFLADGRKVIVRGEFQNPLEREIADLEVSAWCRTSEGTELGIGHSWSFLIDGASFPIGPSETTQFAISALIDRGIVLEECFLSALEKTP